MTQPISAPILTFNEKAPFILVDGSSYLFRAFHSLPPLTNSEGHPTGAIFGVVNMVGKLLEQYQPERIAVVFDAKGKNFRHEMYAEYKSHRPPMPDELRVQIEPIKEIIAALGIPLLIIDGVEADDVMGTLAEQATQAKMTALLSTGDKDMAQLVNEHVSLINTMNDQLMTPDSVFEKFHVKPEQIIDYLALMGDSSDNIPGVPKCGPKTAVKWLDAYGTIENLIEHADEIKGKVGENLRNNLAQLRLSQQLTTIRLNCELPIALENIKRTSPNMAKLSTLLAEYDLRKWQGLVASGEVPFSKSTGKKAQSNTVIAGVEESVFEKIATNGYETILDWSAFNTWLIKLEKATLYAIDTETTSLNTMQAKIVGLSFAVEEDDKISAAYLPLMHDYIDAPVQLPFDEVMAKLKPILEDKTPKKIGQNLKYDWHVFQNHGIELNGIAFDTMLESYCYNSVATRHNMDALALKYLNHSCISFKDIAGVGKKQLTFNQISLEQASPYAAEDADITLQLHLALLPKLSASEKPKAIFTDLEMPLLTVLAKTERNGVLIDKQMLADQSYELGNKLVALEEKAHAIAGEKFNLNSSKQLQVILFEKLKLPILKKTPKGAASTAEPVLVQLAEDGHEIPTLILEYRSLAKLKSTYTDSLPKQIDADTGRIHTSYQQAVAATGRLSSTEPNLQNIPIRSEEGRRIRQAFIAPEGYQLVAGDYSQIELRIMAHLSKDEGLLTAFAAGRDIHQATAAEIFNIALEEVTTDQRRSAKAVNFGLIYGMSAFGLAKQLKISRGLAQEYINLYFNRYPGVKTYMETTQAEAKETGFVETLQGRRLYLPDINAKNGMLRQYAERTAINAPMQGTAADIIKQAMIDMQNWLDETELDIKLLMQVHDELVFEIAEQDVEQAKAKIKQIMENAEKLSVPLIVELGQGINWDEAH